MAKRSRTGGVAAVGLVVATTVLVSAPSGAATVTVCASGCAFSAVAPAVAAAASGDTVTIGAGTYDVTGVVLTRPVTLRGAGSTQTVLVGTPTAAGGAVLGIVPSTGAGAITVEQLRVEVPGTTWGTAPYAGIVVGGGTSAVTAVDLHDLDVAVVGDISTVVVGTGVRVATGAAAVPRIRIATSRIFAPSTGIDVVAYDGRVEIGDNTLANGFPNAQKTTGISVAGSPAQVQIDGNSFAGQKVGISLGGPGSAVGPVALTDNYVRASTLLYETLGLSIHGGVASTTVVGTTFTGSSTGIVLAPEGSTQPGPVDVHESKFLTLRATIANTSTTTVSAEDNWWGCQDGPLASDRSCGSTGPVVADRWVRVRYEALGRTPDAEGRIHVDKGESVPVEVSLVWATNDSEAPVGTPPAVLEGLPVFWGALIGQAGTLAGDDYLAGAANGAYGTYIAPGRDLEDTSYVALDTFNGFDNEGGSTTEGVPLVFVVGTGQQLPTGGTEGSTEAGTTDAGGTTSTNTDASFEVTANASIDASVDASSSSDMATATNADADAAAATDPDGGNATATDPDGGTLGSATGTAIDATGTTSGTDEVVDPVIQDAEGSTVPTAAPTVSVAGPAALPSTGADVPPWMPVAALVLVLVGFVITRRRAL